MTFPSEAFPSASFDGLAFAYSDNSLKGGIRYAVHEFPHSAGGEPEKMGRKPYVISFHSFFHDVGGSDLARKYPDAYPNGLRLMREKFEIQLTGDLVIPSVGKIKAVATDWVQRFDARSPTGESFDMEFIEDQASVFLITAAESLVAGAASLDEASQALFGQSVLAEMRLAETQSFFQTLHDAVNLVQGVLGAADAFNQVIAGKLEGLADLCSFGDTTLTEMQDPTNHVVVNALKDLGFASRQLADNVSGGGHQTLSVYTVPKVMTIGQVASVLYGSTERGSDILQINAINDAFAIPAGTQLKYVKD
jgi:prophage DNA circulation protein